MEVVCMCGRYYIDEETAMELEKLVKDIDKKLKPQYYKEDIVPSATAPVIIGQNQEMLVKLLSWGFQSYDNKRLLINARAETLDQKRTFKECLYARRCAVVSAGFYEWDKSRNKFTFTQEQSKLMLMADIYYGEGRIFNIKKKTFSFKKNQTQEKKAKNLIRLLP